MEETEHKKFFQDPQDTHAPAACRPGGRSVLVHFQVQGRAVRSAWSPRAPNPLRPLGPAGTPEREQAKAISALDIQGSPEFKGRVTGALKLIWMADRDTFLFVKNTSISSAARTRRIFI